MLDAQTRPPDDAPDAADEVENGMLPPPEEGVGIDLSAREPAWRSWLAFSVPLAAAGFSGSREPWALALIAFLVALNVALVPLQTRLPRLLRWALLLLLLLPLTAFLPLGHDSWPQWRQSLRDDFGVDTPSLRSPQPWVTLESWMLLSTGLAWAWHCLTRGFAEDGRRRLVRALSLLIALLAVVALTLKHRGLPMPSFWRGRWDLISYLGPFPNRNAFGPLLAMGAVLSLAAAYDARRRKSAAWILHALCVVPMFWAVLANTSRGGVILFFVATAAWMALASFSRRSAQRVAVSVTVLLALGTVFLIYGRRILERFKTSVTAETVRADGRLKIYSDTVNYMILPSPLMGCTLGNFEPVFARQRTFFNSESRELHPESDWLLLAAEAGVPAALLVLGALGLYVRRTGPWRTPPKGAGRKDRRLRKACAVAALVLPLAGVVDPAAHNPGLSFTALLLAGMSLRQRRPVQELRAGRKVMPLAALFCTGCGVIWLSASAGRPLLPGHAAALLWERRAGVLSAHGDLEGAYDAIGRAIANQPLQFIYYTKRAVIGLPLGLPPQVVLADFLRARFLEPHSWRLCFDEAGRWATHYPEFAMQAWREAMRRDPSRQRNFYSGPLGLLAKNPELRPAVRSLATSPRLKLDYLGVAERGEFDSVLHDLLEQTPELEAFAPGERQGIFRMWYDKGDRAALLEALKNKPAWRADGWPVLALDRAKAGNFAEACRIALESEPQPTEGSVSRGMELTRLVSEFYRNPTDIAAGFGLYEAQKGKNMNDEALVTLDKIASLPDAPPRVLYEQGVILYRKADYVKAWEKISAYIARRPVPSGDK